jgi:hypothetical protein
VNITKGAKLQVSANTTLTGTTEISYDGTASDWATMRAATPKVLPATASPYGTCYFE